MLLCGLFLCIFMILYISFRNAYTSIGNGSLFENAEDAIMPIGNGMVLRTGISKGVRVIENDGQPTPAVVIDFKKSPFYAAQWLIDSVADMCNKQPPTSPQDRIWSIIEKYYGGKFVYLFHSMAYLECESLSSPHPEIENFYKKI